MIAKWRISALTLCFIVLMGLAQTAVSRVELYPQSIDAAFEYDNNVTRQKLHKDYQGGLVWRLYTGFGIKNFIPLKRLDTRAEYTLGMRDVNTSNNEDYNAHNATLSSSLQLGTGTSLNLHEAFKIWNSQSDLFHFYNNSLKIWADQTIGQKTLARLSYGNGQKWFQNSAPEVQARNFFYHQLAIDLDHNISNDFTVKTGYIYNFTIYNRSPVKFEGGRPIALEGTQKDRQNIVTLGFQTNLLNTKVNLTLLNQIVRSNSNSPAFNFSGNRTRVILLINPIHKLWIRSTYQITAYDLGAYQTPEKGYELSEIRTEDQSGITLVITYNLSQAVAIRLRYEHIENSVFFTKDFYEKNTFSTGLLIRF